MRRLPLVPPGVRALSGLLAVLGLGACASADVSTGVPAPGLIDRLTPYKVLIQQGNVVTREQVALIKPGMARDQVREILGSPMLTDVFHAARWDYPYAVQRRTTAPDQRWSVTVHFDGEMVQRVEAPELPSEVEFVARMAGPSKPTKAPFALELSPEEKAKLKPPVRVESPGAAQPQGANRTYPPLESR